MTETWAYQATNTIEITGDLTAKYWRNQLIKINQGTEKFFVVTAVALVNGNTRLTVSGGGVYTLTSDAITAHYMSVSMAPTGLPNDFFDQGQIYGAASKTTPADDDKLSIWDSAALFVRKSLTWSNLKAALNSIYVIAAGKSGGQTINGGTGSGENLTLASTSHATKGNVILAPTRGNVGIGNTDIEAWSTYYYQAVIESLDTSIAFGKDTSINIISNAYYDAAWKYKTADLAAMIYLYKGEHRFNVAPAGTLDAVITWKEAMRITNAGNIGICGTPNSAHKLSVQNDGASSVIACIAFGGFDPSLCMYGPRGTQESPTKNLSGDPLGSIYFGGWDTALSNGARIYATAAADWGDSSIDNPTNLHFATCADGSGTLTDRMVILSSGHVGIGVTAPTVGLELANAATSGKIICYDLYANNNVSALTFTDRTEAFIDNALEAIKQIKATEAGEIEHSTLPMFVVEPYQDENGEWWPGRSIGGMVSVLTKAVQELQEKYESAIAERDAKIADLTSRLEAIEQKLAS